MKSIIFQLDCFSTLLFFKKIDLQLLNAVSEQLKSIVCNYYRSLSSRVVVILLCSFVVYVNFGNNRMRIVLHQGT